MRAAKYVVFDHIICPPSAVSSLFFFRPCFWLIGRTERTQETGSEEEKATAKAVLGETRGEEGKDAKQSKAVRGDWQYVGEPQRENGGRGS